MRHGYWRSARGRCVARQPTEIARTRSGCLTAFGHQSSTNTQATKGRTMFTQVLKFSTAAALVVASLFNTPVKAQVPTPGADGIIKVKSAYSVEETIRRARKDIADK